MDIQASALVGKGLTVSYTPVKANKVGVDAKPGVEELNSETGNIQAGSMQEQYNMSTDEIKKPMDDLNKIMQLVNADLQFEIHEKTQRLMVRLVDVKTDKVLKEFPPHELLDTIAAIRDYIGFLLDKKV